MMPPGRVAGNGVRPAEAPRRERKHVDDAGLWVYVHDLRLVGRVAKVGAIRPADDGKGDGKGDVFVVIARDEAGAGEMRDEIEHSLIALGRATMELSPAWATYADLSLAPDPNQPGALTNMFQCGVAKLMGLDEGIVIGVSSSAISFLDDFPPAARERMLDNLERLAAMGAGGPRIEIAR